METEVKIILYPEEHKSKNGTFFEELIRNIMETQRYEIVPNINFTGLEIDLMATHKDRDEVAYIECKAKEKVNSKELKNFVFSVSHHKVNYGYFIHTIELDHQVAGLKKELEDDPEKRYKHITFLGPDKIIELLIENKRIKRIDWTEIETVENFHKLILAYTYFGIYYIVIPFEGTKTAKYYLFDASTGEQIHDAAVIADKDHSPNITIDNALKNGISDIKNLRHFYFDKDKTDKPGKESTVVDSLETGPKETSKPRLLFLFPDPIDKNFGYEFHDLTRGFIKCDVEVDCMYLSEKTLEQLDEYNYAFIFTGGYKNKIYVEDEIFKSKLLSVKDFEQALFTDDRITKGIFLFTPEKIDFKGIVTEKPIVNIVSNHEKLKNDLPQLIHHLFSKQEYKGKFDFNFLNKEKIEHVRFNKTSEKLHPHIILTKLPDLIDPKTLQNFVGRKVDQENIIRKVLELEHSAKILNIKGSGGIGKTAVAKKVAFELAKRNHFNEGIHFIACEHITDAGTFEAKAAQCFDMDNVINLKEHLKDYERFDSLIILDNFESLLTFENKNAIEQVKDLVSFVSDYASIVITSRQIIGYEFEDIYDLYALTTDEALELFYTNYGKLGKEEEIILRRDILENLLNNNPLAIKIITRNLPKHKNIISLKEELEENFFAKTSENVEEIFDRDADVNIEKTRSLFHSINYSYQKLDGREKLTFELLYLFPDGIHLENFKNCFAKGSERKSLNQISDFQIKSLENKSLVENNSGFIRLQSILGRFAHYQFEKRTPEEKSKYFKDAFSYNNFYLNIIAAIRKKKSETLALSMFDSIANNVIDILDYLDKFEEDNDLIMKYIDFAARYSVEVNQSTKIEKKSVTWRNA